MSRDSDAIKAWLIRLSVAAGKGHTVNLRISPPRGLFAFDILFDILSVYKYFLDGGCSRGRPIRGAHKIS